MEKMTKVIMNDGTRKMIDGIHVKTREDIAEILNISVIKIKSWQHECITKQQYVINKTFEDDIFRTDFRFIGKITVKQYNKMTKTENKVYLYKNEFEGIIKDGLRMAIWDD